MAFCDGRASAVRKRWDDAVMCCSSTRSSVLAAPPPRLALPILSSRATSSILPPPAAQEPASGAVTMARIYLLTAGALWGSYPVVLRALYAAPGPVLPPMFVVAARFVLTSLIFAFMHGASSLRERRRHRAVVWSTPGTRARVVALEASLAAPTPHQATRHAALELALIGLVGNFLSVWGLAHVAAALAETLLGCVHVFVPLITVAAGGAVGLRTWQACAVSFAAVCVAALSSAPGSAAAAAAAAPPPLLGLAALVGAAGLYSLGRVRAQHHVGVRRLNSFDINRLRMAAMGTLATGALVLDAVRVPTGASRAILSSLGSVTGSQWLLVLLSCVASGVLGSSLQYRAQKTLPAASAQPFFGLQPLFACAWTAMFLAEPVAPTMVFSGGLMLAGALIASTDASTVGAAA